MEDAGSECAREHSDWDEKKTDAGMKRAVAVNIAEGS